MDLNDIIDYGSCLLPAIPAIIGIRFYKRIGLSEKAITLLSLFGIGICGIAIIGQTMGNSMPALHLWTILEFSCVSAFYYVLINNKKLKHFILISSILFLIFSIINSIYIQGIFIYNSHARGLEATLLTLFSLVYLVYILYNETFFKPELSSTKYIVIGMIIYYGFTQLLYLSFNYLQFYNKSLTVFAYEIHRWVYLLFNILLAIGLWKKKLKQT